MRVLVPQLPMPRPTDERLLSLVCASVLLPDERVRAAADGFSARDWHRGLELCAHHRIDDRLRVLGARLGWSDGGVPDDVRSSLISRRAAREASNDRLREAALELVDRAGAVGLPLVVRKGLPLAQLAYGDVGGRAMGDIDLLVARDDIRALNDLLAGLGYLNGELTRAGVVPWRRELEMALAIGGQNAPGWVRVEPDGGASEIGIALDLFDRRSGHHVAAPELIGRSQLVAVPGGSLPALGDLDFMLDLCGHFWKDSRSPVTAAWGTDVLLYKFVDIAHFAQRLSSQGAWPELMSVIDAMRMHEPVAFAIGYVTEIVGGVVPADVVDWALASGSWLGGDPAAAGERRDRVFAERAAPTGVPRGILAWLAENGLNDR
jgi:hypothetical protein